ncbi:MAG TPA: hypothetical protein PKZ22_10530 [Accumulibacter sp.]|jgi:putative transposase|nr:hypothetical protein [Accumulibacter sp.]
MIDKTHALPVVRPVQWLEFSLSSVSYPPPPIPEADRRLMRRIDEPYLAHPFSGARMPRDLVIERPIQVWALGTTLIPMPRGFISLRVVLDGATRRVPSGRRSNRQAADPCVDALEEAFMNRVGRNPEYRPRQPIHPFGLHRPASGAPHCGPRGGKGCCGIMSSSSASGNR